VRITLLGPQRRPRVDSVVRALGLAGPFATVTAGWQERETEDGELDQLLGGQTINLRLYGRWNEVTDRDPEFAAANLRRREVLAELAELYLIRLDQAADAVFALLRRGGSPSLLEPVLVEAEQAVRDLDTAQSARVDEVHAEFYDAFPPHEREPIAAVRAEIGAILGDCSAFVMTGGHVGVLSELLHLFNLAALLDVPIVTWSAGAMALTERIVLFHDRSTHGPASAEVFEQGLGLVRGVVALPAAHRRLHMDDQVRMALFARRFAPARCLVLEAGDRVDLTPEGRLPRGAPILSWQGLMANSAVEGGVEPLPDAAWLATTGSR
jgi:hypothetical protein